MSLASNPKVTAVIVASAIIMQQIDSTAITTALPQMAISFNVDPIRLSVAVTAYLLSLAVFIRSAAGPRIGSADAPSFARRSVYSRWAPSCAA